MTKKLESEMVNLLAGLREMQHDQAEKWEKKTWTNIDIPFTLPERLHTYTKSDLDEIRKFLRIKGASSLKKAELISWLKKAIPLFLKNICLQWDNERFTLLAKIAHHGGYMTAPEFTKEQINYLRKSGIIYCGTFQGNKILALPDELIEPIKVLEKDENVTSAVARNTEWIKLTRGLLYYYGTLSVSELMAMVKKYTKGPIEVIEYLEVMYDANSYQKELQIAHDGFSNIRVFDPKRVKQEHRQRENLSFYPFSKNQLLQAGEPGFVERSKSYIRLVNYLTLNYEISKVEADKIVEECVYAIQIGESPNDIMQFLSQSFVFEDMEDVQELMGMVVELMNNTKEWFLKGHSPEDIMADEKETLNPLPVLKLKQRVTKINEKIGRNDPCPCGSGKKYKKCCGQ